jgi:hypothetical protein
MIDVPASKVETGSTTGDAPRCFWGLAAIIVGFLILRLPFVLYQPGGQDEQLFSVPGYTIATEGIPRIPYYPGRQPGHFFYRADEIMLEMPPALFYLQAPFYLMFSGSNLPGRLPSLLAGVVAILLIDALGRRVAGTAAGLWAAGLFAASRLLFFAATFARPDAVCAAFGLGAILVLWDLGPETRLRRVAAAGVLLGAGLLTHPFAIVYCLLCGVWMLVRRVLWRTAIISASVLTTTAVAVFALWIPLILMNVDLFQHQFFSILHVAGPGLFQRLLWPWTYLIHQAGLLYEQAGAWQTAVLGLGAVAATVFSLRKEASPSLRKMIALMWGAVYLMSACQGLHPNKSYWCFTGALMFVAAGVVAARLMSMLSKISRSVAFAVGLGIAVLFVPQSGARMWLAYAKDHSSTRYNGPRFTQEMIDALPIEGRYIVDQMFVFDFWLAGRDVIVLADPNQFLDKQLDYDWLVASREAVERGMPERLHARPDRIFGPKNDELACYAELFQPAARTKP